MRGTYLLRRALEESTTSRNEQGVPRKDRPLILRRILNVVTDMILRMTRSSNGPDSEVPELERIIVLELSGNRQLPPSFGYWGRTMWLAPNPVLLPA